MSPVWFVECRVNEKFDGWFAAPPEGIGGWRTMYEVAQQNPESHIS